MTCFGSTHYQKFLKVERWDMFKMVNPKNHDWVSVHHSVFTSLSTWIKFLIIDAFFIFLFLMVALQHYFSMFFYYAEGFRYYFIGLFYLCNAGDRWLFLHFILSILYKKHITTVLQVRTFYIADSVMFMKIVLYMISMLILFYPSISTVRENWGEIWKYL